MKIALTFDIERDIPNILNTYEGVKVGLIKILEILDEYKIKGTFFCTGNVAITFPEYIRLIECKGHEIACHGFNHERLNILNFKECQELIYQNKKVIQEICHNSKIIGFRAPYLKPPKFLFAILDNLGFKYDSSFKFRYKIDKNQKREKNIQEFYPLNSLLRFPPGHYLLKKFIFKKKLAVLYFHPFEAINMKRLLSCQISELNLFKDFILRPDRWINTGSIFISKTRYFIEEALSMKAEFVTLKQLINS